MWNPFKFEKFLLWRKKYSKIVNLIAILVVFATTYALILPALTLDQDKADQTSGINTQLAPSTTENGSGQITTLEAPVVPAAPQADTPAPTDSQEPATTEASSESTPDQEKITEPTTMVQKGDGYELTAEFDASAQFPKGVELKVRELDSQSEEYKVHYDKAKETLRASSLSYARFFDIQFLYEGNEVEPAAPVKISIKNDKALQLGEDSKLKIVHFEDANTKNCLCQVF